MQWRGKSRTTADKAKKSRAAKINVLNKKNPFASELTCPHCLLKGQGPNMTRWHFDNCKHKNN